MFLTSGAKQCSDFNCSPEMGYMVGKFCKGAWHGSLPSMPSQHNSGRLGIFPAPGVADEFDYINFEASLRPAVVSDLIRFSVRNS